jgi:hypothetical protein
MAILLFMLCIDEFAAGRRALFVLKQKDTPAKGKG